MSTPDHATDDRTPPATAAAEREPAVENVAHAPAEASGNAPDGLGGRSIGWAGDAIVAVDQTALPHAFRTLRLTTVDDVIDAIRRLAIRGAPAIGVAGALGVALSAHRHRDTWRDPARRPEFLAAVRADADRLADARPTAVNLAVCARRATARLADGPDAVLAEALAILDEDEGINRAAARRAADLIRALRPDGPLRLLTHCNTGGLATVAWGTALGAIRYLAEAGAVAEVLVDESRPLLQGARLTVWELARAGIPHRLCADSAGVAALATQDVDCVVVGADRVAANGDVANKVGTYALACAAARNGVPFVVVAPESTVDPDTPNGAAIVVEQRAAEEVTTLAGTPITLPGTRVFNPAFDVTPHELITAVVTERAVRPGGAAARPARRAAATAAVDRPAPAAVGAALAERIRVVPDFPAPGVAFQDLAGLYADPALLRAVAQAIGAHPWGRVDRIAALEARGFPVAGALAALTGWPLALIRKPGKLPGATRSVRYGLEYGTDRLEAQVDAVRPGERVLLVDDVLATGGTLRAAAELVTAAGGEVAGYAVLVELAALAGRKVIDDAPVLALHTIRD